MIPGRLRLRFVVAAGLLVLHDGHRECVDVLRAVPPQRHRHRHRAAERVRHGRHLEARGRARTGGRCGPARSSPATIAELECWHVSGRSSTRRSPISSASWDRTTNASSPHRSKRSCSAYRHAADGVIAVAPEREALVQYHQKANPVLRRAVALTTAIRDRHFELARAAVAGRGTRPRRRAGPSC